MENNMARKTKYIVKLNKSERGKLNKLVKYGKIAAAKRYRAQIFCMLTKDLMALAYQIHK